jgi:hypothetical protein
MANKISQALFLSCIPTGKKLFIDVGNSIWGRNKQLKSL